MFPINDFTVFISDMQSTVNGLVNQTIVIGVKMAILVAAFCLVLFLVPRGVRFFAGLAFLAAVWLYPAACSRLLDAAVAALAGMGLVPQFHPDLLSLAGL